MSSRPAEPQSNKDDGYLEHVALLESRRALLAPNKTSPQQALRQKPNV